MEEHLRDLDSEEVHRHNNEAAREIVDAVRSTLGPTGMDKMLVDANGNVVVTNDGATVLQEMAIEEPIGKLLLGIANEQVSGVSDGTTTAILLAGELLTGALELLDRGIHPTTIGEGYELANQFVKRELVDIAVPFDAADFDAMRQVARSATNGKGRGVVSQERLVNVAVETVRGVTVDGHIDLDLIKIDKSVGDTAVAMQVHDGGLFKGEPAHPDMPRTVVDADILTLNGQLKPPEVSEVRARVDDHQGLRQFHEDERTRTDVLVDQVRGLGVDAVFFVEAADDELARRLAKRNVFAGNVSRPKIRFLKTVLGSSILPDLSRATANDLGYGHVRYDSAEDWFNVESEGTPGVTVSIRGSVEQLVDELHRSLTDATDAIGEAVDDGFVLAGGGGTEVELAQRLRSRAPEVTDRRQLVLETFARALEAIPRELTRNAGMDPIEAMIELRNEHAEGNQYVGVEPTEQTVADMRELGVVEPVSVKARAIDLATEVAAIIARADGMIPAEGSQVLVRSDDEEADDE